MALNNDFRTNRRTFNERGGFFGVYTGVDSLYPSAGIYSINTSGPILSGGVNLTTLFSPISTGVSSTTLYTTVNTNSASWSNAYTTTNATSSVYTITNANSANWSNAYTTTNATSSVYTAYNSASANILATSISTTTQGNITIPRLFGSPESITLSGLGTDGSPRFQNLTLTGNLSVLGDLSYLNTNVSTTSALSVVNAGSGPALVVKQTGPEAIAYFDGVEGGVSSTILFADNGFVGLGIGTTTPNNRLTVAGNISSSAVVYTSGGNSDQWSSTYTYVNGASSKYFLDGGNSPTADMNLGPSNSFGLNLKAFGSTRIALQSNGNVNIGPGGSTIANEKLTVSGNISATGAAALSGAILRDMFTASATTGNRLVTQETNGTLTYIQLPAGASNVNGLVPGLQTNRLTKSTSTTTTLTASTIVDTGAAVQLDRNITFIQQQTDAAGGTLDAQIIRSVYTGTISAGPFASMIPTLSTGNGVQNLIYSRHNILLYTANANRTAYEVVASNLTTAGSVSGTIFGIVDVGTTLLGDTDVINNGIGTTLLLAITGAAACKTLIESIGYYAITT